MEARNLLFRQIFRKVFLEDWVMKVVALAITLALWFGVTGLSRPTTQRLTSIPLTLRYSNNIEVTYSPLQEVSLLVSGDSRRLAQLNERDVVASIDISDVPPGDRVIPLTPMTVAVSLPTGIKVDEILPRSMALRIEAVEEKEVPVEAETFGELPPGYELYAKTVTPPKVRVRGPSSFIRALDAVPTERIDLANRIADFTARQVPVSVSNPNASVISDMVVDVAFRIGERRIERVFVVPFDDESGRRARVVLYGGRSALDEIEATAIRVEIYRTDAGRDAVRAILPAQFDGRVEVRSVELRG